MQKATRRRAPLLRIVEMNLGFFGLQIAFGLQLANSSPIFRTLGASETMLPLLWLAGPVAGFLVQPLVGVLSDRTRTRWGKRTPYILAGAIAASLVLLALPHSPALWIAVSLVWILDGAANMALEPYRAYVADGLTAEERTRGFLTQSAFSGLSQTFAFGLPSLLALFIDRNLLDANGIPAIVRITFVAGAVIALSTVLYSLWRVREGPAAQPARSSPARAPWRDFVDALRDMPPLMRQLALPMLCQWYAMFAYWQFITDAIAQTHFGTSDPHSPAYRDAVLMAQQLGAAYNAFAFLGGFALIPLARRIGLRNAHTLCLTASGLGILLLAFASTTALLPLAALGLGLGWAGMMGNTYAMLASAIPARRNGVYMGIFNMFIVVPMLLESTTMPLLYHPLLGSNPSNSIAFAGLIMLLGAVATLRLDLPDKRSDQPVTTGE